MLEGVRLWWAGKAAEPPDFASGVNARMLQDTAAVVHALNRRVDELNRRVVALEKDRDRLEERVAELEYDSDSDSYGEAPSEHDELCDGCDQFIDECECPPTMDEHRKADKGIFGVL